MAWYDHKPWLAGGWRRRAAFNMCRTVGNKTAEKIWSSFGNCIGLVYTYTLTTEMVARRVGWNTVDFVMTAADGVTIVSSYTISATISAGTSTGMIAALGSYYPQHMGGFSVFIYYDNERIEKHNALDEYENFTFADGMDDNSIDTDKWEEWIDDPLYGYYTESSSGYGTSFLGGISLTHLCSGYNYDLHTKTATFGPGTEATFRFKFDTATACGGAIPFPSNTNRWSRIGFTESNVSVGFFDDYIYIGMDAGIWQTRVANTTGVTITVITDPVMMPDTWYTCSIRYLTGAVLFYVDGKLIQTITTNVPTTDLYFKWASLAYSAFVREFVDHLDYVVIYSTIDNVDADTHIVLTQLGDEQLTPGGVLANKIFCIGNQGPYVYNDAVGYTGNAVISYTPGAGKIAFVNSNPDTITDSDSGFVSEGFVAGDIIRVADSTTNDGLYHVTAVVAGTLTIHTKLAVNAETPGGSVTISTPAQEPLLDD